jgi:hypothetical protein
MRTVDDRYTDVRQSNSKSNSRLETVATVARLSLSKLPLARLRSRSFARSYKRCWTEIWSCVIVGRSLDDEISGRKNNTTRQSAHARFSERPIHRVTNSIPLFVEMTRLRNTTAFISRQTCAQLFCTGLSHKQYKRSFNKRAKVAMKQ